MLGLRGTQLILNSNRLYNVNRCLSSSITPNFEKYEMYKDGVTTKTWKTPVEHITVPKTAYKSGTNTSNSTSNSTFSSTYSNTSSDYGSVTGSSFGGSVITFAKIDHNRGLANFMKTTYLTTGIGISSSIVLALAADYSGFALQHPGICLGGGIIAAFAGIFGLSSTKYHIWNSKEGLTSTNSLERRASFAALTAGMGLSIAPMVSVVSEISPKILPMSAALSLATMGGASLYAYRSENAKLLRLKAPLMGALTGLVGMGLVALGSGFLFGNNMFLQMLHHVDTYAGIALFTAFTAYDTHVAIDRYEKGDPDHLGCATDFYLDFMNFLVRFMEIVAKMKKN